MINIHHSFLPAFVGAKPYAQAYQRGIQRVDHRHGIEEPKRIGRHVERVLVHGNKTVVFA